VLGETINLNETLGAPLARALENLFAKIDAEPARQPTTSLNLDGRISEFLAGLSPRTLAWSATAAALAIVVQAGFLADIMLKETKEDGLRNRIGSQHRSGRGRVCLDPVCTAGIVR
ncbi:MAG: hypothetical protein WCD83_27815, partial [Pseudolabrys sp.]